MNRKTATILCAAGSLCAAAALLGARSSRSSVPTPQPPETPIDVPTPPPVAATCGTAAPSRAAGVFGPGSFTAALSGGHALLGSDGEMYVSVELTANRAETTARPPMSLAIVIDHSGSMQGEKIVKAREAARGLIERLAGGDRAALIQYDDTAEVLVPSTAMDEPGRRRLLRAIDSIQDAGGTNIHDGMVLGRDEILRTMASGHVNRVVVLSDGNANVGITDLASLSRAAGDASERGVRISTVGLGADYNEDLMEAIAENGRGQYYYVKDATTLDAVFAGELRAIQATVATGAELRLEPACAGVEIAEVIGYVSRREGNAVIVPLADIAGGDKRKIVARVHVPTDKAGKSGVLTASLAFATPSGKTDTAIAAVGVEVTGDAALVEKTADADVLGKVEQAQSALVLRRAAQAYEKGDQAGAVRMIRVQREESAKKAARYKMKEADMRTVYDSLDSMGAGMAETSPSAAAAPAMTKKVKADAYMMAK